MNNESLRKAKYSDIIKYAFGGLGSNLPFMLIMMYMTFFYTDVFGISPFAASGLMLTARLIDAVTDPLMGMIADNTRSKLGRFRPYLLFGAPFLGLSVFLLFTTPSLTPGQKIVYAYVVYIAYSLLSTVCNIPYHSLTAVLSEEPSQRTLIVTWKQGMAIFPSLLISFALPIVSAFGAGTTSVFGWSVLGGITGVCTTLSFLICAWGGKPYDTMERVAVSKNASANKNFFSDLKMIFKNFPLIMLLIAFGTDLLAASFSSAVNTYYFKYVLHQEAWIPVVSVCSLISSVLSIALTFPLSQRFGKKAVIWWTSLLAIVPNVLLLFIQNPALALLCVILTSYGLVSGIAGILGWAMLPDCVDWGEYTFKKRLDGLTTSTMTFINKLASAVAGSAALAILGSLGYVANQEQTQTVCTAIIVMRFALPILGHIASVIALHFYELTEPKVREISLQLSNRRNDE